MRILCLEGELATRRDWVEDEKSKTYRTYKTCLGQVVPVLWSLDVPGEGPCTEVRCRSLHQTHSWCAFSKRNPRK